MQFEVRALSTNHVMTLISIDAIDEVDARRQVEAQGLYASSISPARGLRHKKSMKGQLSLVLFSQELLALLNAGLSIVESLEALSEKEANPAHSIF